MAVNRTRQSRDEEIQAEVRRLAEANAGGLVWAASGPTINIITAEQVRDAAWVERVEERGPAEFRRRLQMRGQR